MTLETMLFQKDLSSYGSKDIYNLGLLGQNWSYNNYGFQIKRDETPHDNFNADHHGIYGKWDTLPSSMMQYPKESENSSNYYSSPEACCTADGLFSLPENIPATMSSRRKRRRTKCIKNKDEVENQRMAHITVERNRRKQMNEYLSILRSLMPSSYVQRGDQASIVGGAINFVKELEQLVQSLQAHKQASKSTTSFSSLFSDFFTFPQYSTSTTLYNNLAAATESVADLRCATSVADVEVSMAESHANIKVLTQRQPRQLLKMVARLHSIYLTILHLNITTADPMVLYSISVKAEDNCQLTSMNDIAAAVYEMMERIREEAAILV